MTHESLIQHQVDPRAGSETSAVPRGCSCVAIIIPRFIVLRIADSSILLSRTIMQALILLLLSLIAVVLAQITDFSPSQIHIALG